MTYAKPLKVGSLRKNMIMVSGIFTLASPGPDPTIVAGTGWTVTRISPANYRVTLVDSIARFESITCTMAGDNFPYFCTLKYFTGDPPGPDTASFIVETFILQSGTLQPTDSNAALCSFLCYISI